MAVKKVTYKGGALIDTTSNYFGFAADDTSGLYYIPSKNNGEPETAFSTLTHIVTESKNPLWNQITYDITRNVVSSSLYDGHVTLQGLKDDGTFEDLMEHHFTDTSNSTTKNVFDLLASACSGAQIDRIPNGGSGGAGTFDVGIPLRYGKYEDVDVMPAWFNSSWTTRKAFRINKSGGRLHNGRGHLNQYKILTIGVIYDADMNADFSDLRFTGPDGISECAYYILRKTNSVSATVLVAVPAHFIDKEAIKHRIITYGAYAEDEPICVYMYYGNSTATTMSDITLNGYTAFYDNFDDASIDTSKWTSTGGTVTETSGYLELKIPSSSNATASIISRDIDDTLDHTITFQGNRTIEVIWEIENITPLSGTTINQGPIMRIRNSSDQYFECRCNYQAAGYLGGSAQYYFGNVYNGGVMTYPYPSGTDTTAKRWIKCVYSQAAVATIGVNGGFTHVAWYHSFDGYEWDIIGYDNATTGGPQTGAIQLAMYEIGPNTVASDRLFRISQVIAYETTGSEYDFMDDHFNNNALVARWNTSATTGTLTESASTITATGTAGSNHLWTGAAWNPVGFYTATKQGGYSKNSIHTYEAKLNNIGAVASGSAFATINLFNETTASTMEAIHFGVERTSAGVVYPYVIRQTNGVQTNLFNNAAGNVSALGTADNIYLRMIVDPYLAVVSFNYSLDGIEWILIGSSTTIYSDVYLSGSYYGLFWRNTTTVTGSCVWDYIKVGSLGRESFSNSTFSAEEKYSSYPLEPVSPTNDDITLRFNKPTGMVRNNAVFVRTKKFGGGYSNSKVQYISDADYIKIGADGVDKYIGMKLVFDFTFADTDTFNCNEISVLYEVI